jgi:hypothetical protein
MQACIVREEAAVGCVGRGIITGMGWSTGAAACPCSGRSAPTAPVGLVDRMESK